VGGIIPIEFFAEFARELISGELFHHRCRLKSEDVIEVERGINRPLRNPSKTTQSLSIRRREPISRIK
jgi:hypothetical protein